MSIYSSEADIQQFVADLGPNPLIVCDLDGNIYEGFKVAPGTAFTLDAAKGDNPQKQDIPFGTTRRQIDALVAEGKLTKSIFAGKVMDVRLPQNLVDMMNDAAEKGDDFKIATLTSREMEEARKILIESGVKYIDKVTMIADSGARMRIGGEVHVLRALSDDENKFLQGLKPLAENIQPDIDAIVRKYKGDEAMILPLYFEEKGIAANIHYRDVVEKNGYSENSAMDIEMRSVLKKAMTEYMANAPRDAAENPAFKQVSGPMTEEVIIASGVNKGVGLEALVKAAVESGKAPSAVVFSGDDICAGATAPGNGRPGTDWYAAVKMEKISQDTGIPGFVVHTLHPRSGDIDSHEPEELKSVQNLAPEHAKPKIDLLTRTPWETGAIVARALGYTPAEKVPSFSSKNSTDYAFHIG